MAFPTGWTLLGTYTVDNTKVDGSTDLTDFPVPLIDTDGFDANVFSNVDEAGGDLRFSSDEAGSSRLSCHIESFSASGSTAEVYVKRTLDADADTVIYIWGDNTGETQPASDAAYGSEDVWTNYEGVWLFSDDGTDATGNGHTMSPGAAPNYTATGKVGEAADFVPNDYLECSDAALRMTGAQMWSVLHNIDDTANKAYMSTSDGHTGGTMLFSTGSGASDARFNLNYPTNFAALSSALQQDDVLTTSNWHYQAFLFDPDNSDGYSCVDGDVNSYTSTGGALTQFDGNFAIGRRTGYNDFYVNGQIDQVRIISGAPVGLDSYMVTESNSIYDNSNFGTAAEYEGGAEEASVAYQRIVNCS